MRASVGRLVPGYGARATRGAALGAWTQHSGGPLSARVPQHAAPRVDRGPNEPRIRSVSGMPELPSSGEPAGRSGVQPALPALQRAVHNRVGRSPQSARTPRDPTAVAGRAETGSTHDPPPPAPRPP